MRTLTESIFGMVLMMICTEVELLMIPYVTNVWICVVGIIFGIFGAILFYRSAVQAERTLRRRTDINITIEHKDESQAQAVDEGADR